MKTSPKENTASAEPKLRYVSHLSWKRTSIIASLMAVVIFWMLNLALLLGFVSVAHDLTMHTMNVTAWTATLVLAIVVMTFGFRLFLEEERDILEITNDDITFKIVKGRSRETSIVSIPFRDMAYVEHFTPRSEESPMARNSLILHDTSDHKVTVPIWTMTNNVLPILEFLQTRNVRIVNS